MRALELFNEGELRGAIDVATEAVKKSPADPSPRLVLAELLCFAEEFERADKQLEAALIQSPETNLSTALGRQLIRAATARQRCFFEGAVPDMLAPIDREVELQLKLLTLNRAGEFEQVASLLEGLLRYCGRLSGQCDAEAFTGFRDLDDSMVACLEVLTSTGKYYWVPWHRIETLEFQPVVRPRDLLWREAKIVVREGPDAVVYVPVSYPATRLESDGQEAVLARATWWREPEDGLVTGVGQRILLINGKEQPILDVKSLRFDKIEAGEDLS